MKMRILLFVLLGILIVVVKVYGQAFELTKIRFEGNKILSKKELSSVLISRESPSKFWQVLYKINERLGDKARYLEKIKVASDIVSLRNYYFDNGFFDVKIDTLVEYDYSSKKASLTFLIDEGQFYVNEKIDFSGLDKLPDSLRELVFRFSFLKTGVRYRKVDVESEIQRVLNMLYDNGYPNAYVDRAEIKIFVDSVRKVVSIFVPFYPSDRFVIRDVKILIERSSKMRISDDIVSRELEFKRGQYYNQSLVLKSEANLSYTGLFEEVRINIGRVEKRDTINLADLNISLVPRNKQDISPSIYFSDEKNTFNVGVSIDYLNRNFLGGGRNFSASVRFQVQSLNLKKTPTLTDTTSAGLIESNLKLSQPYIWGRKIPGEFGLSLIIDKQKNYLLNIVRSRVRFIYKPNGIYSAFFDWDVESVDIKFQKVVDLGIAKIYQRQLNSILSFTFQIDKTDDLIYPRSGYSHTISVEGAGIMPFLLGQMGFKVLPFSQYYKFGWLLRKFIDLNNSVFAVKFKIGLSNEFLIKSAKKFELQPIPINRRFFAGGSASVRGWRARELGNVLNPSLGGNTLVEINLEDRIILWRNLGGVIFFDAGNLWDDVKHIRLSQFAVASGFGFRYLTIFGGIRVDFGLKIYDPGSKTNLIFKKTGKQILKDMVFHIGVGQTF